ncbi:hypothetical protein O6H91_12G068300 [Diphasiastrum complanatum]|nr:hypothetical protein O6H91_12G059700 [Diphasiastrum complanatum]KAJ7536200.1 hypothetical protein O6H91_12G059700 [Diphasiastrum complanatum]KAJ7536201.1 hypothetical protein O6H91_12G059700 [Diphasiastrum complanatum]KAJ7536203.1 hypothetical protein O6H91_12G059700 [Diphasiastrum complanatum]KAJ7536406.1 hypothetical protein O6H91_12G068300 [Diphasiastrum complanatum]
MAELDGEERVLATAQHIVRSLGTTENMTDDMLNILSNFDDRFSGINTMLPKNQEPVSAEVVSTEVAEELNKALDAAEGVILEWETVISEATSGAAIFDSSSDDGAKYLGAVDEVQNALGLLSVSESNTTENRAQNVLQVAMARLQEEFRHLLATHSQSLDPEFLLDHFACSFNSYTGGADLESKSSLEVSMSSNHQEALEEVASQSSVEEEEDVPEAELQTDPIIDLIPPEVVKSLHEIAQRMVIAGYRRECCQVYGSLRKPVLEESLGGLGFEKLSIDEVQKTTWEVLEGRIKKWIQAMKAGVKILFASERQLCEDIFEESELVENCFAELSRAPFIQLMNFGEAIAISRRSPEKLFRLLDMYETLRDLLADISVIFSGESCAVVREEASGILLRLAEAARGTFTEFENAIAKDTSKVPVPGGAVHPLTRYVMNYVRFLFDYVDTLKHLFGENTDTRDGQGDDNTSPMHDGLSPFAVQTIAIMNVLQSNLDGKSKLYRDLALGYLFLMNNVRYIVQKVDGSEVQALLGDDWLRKHTRLIRRYATDYQRSAWTKILACLKDEGIRTSGSFSNGVSKAVLKERFKNFNAAFEDIHKAQSSWLVPDSQLRLELRISIAENLLPAYRSFLGRYRTFLESERHSEKYIKYTPEDLETYLNDLFEGRTASSQRWRSSSN